MGNPSEIERQYEGNDLPAIRAANAERRRIKEGASAAPWTWRNGDGDREPGDLVSDNGTVVIGSVAWEKNCPSNSELRSYLDADADDVRFIITARSDPVEDVVDYLCDEVERLRAAGSGSRRDSPSAGTGGGARGKGE